ncbi:LOW QUALITY PROTEIN: eukaryotic translation initiation factor 4E-binding protein 3 [Athene noctua]|uniref:LOW QUALITY PROTEIN: eukaryotic translation initiation factor 4E-binding protein 3 n=1 Tax=Athene noctua TaxID=126797 RepID=UPI003EBFFBBE
MGVTVCPVGSPTVAPEPAVSLSCVPALGPPLLWALAVVLGDGGGQGLAVPESPPLLAGTRIIYDRKFLLECKNSPVARTPPCCLPQIPGVTSLAQSSLVKLEELKERNESEEAMPDQDQFEMDI